MVQQMLDIELKRWQFIKPNCVDDLKLSIENFASLTQEERIKMGTKARKKVELEFDENIVLDKYMELLND